MQEHYYVKLQKKLDIYLFQFAYASQFHCQVLCLLMAWWHHGWITVNHLLLDCKPLLSHWNMLKPPLPACDPSPSPLKFKSSTALNLRCKTLVLPHRGSDGSDPSCIKAMMKNPAPQRSGIQIGWFFIILPNPFFFFSEFFTHSAKLVLHFFE